MQEPPGLARGRCGVLALARRRREGPLARSLPVRGSVIPYGRDGRACGAETGARTSSTLKALAVDVLGFLLATERFVFYSSIKEKITNSVVLIKLLIQFCPALKKDVMVRSKQPQCNEMLVNYCILGSQMRPVANNKSIKPYTFAI